MAGTVIILEDDDSNRKILETTVRKMGFEVMAAQNGEEGLQLLEQTKPLLIFVDVMMPRLSGFDFLRRLRGDAKIKDIPVVVISAKASDQDIELARELGASDFIAKPFRVTHIQEAVKKFCNKRESV